MDSQKSLFSKFDPQPDPSIKLSRPNVVVESALAVPVKPEVKSVEKQKKQPEIKAKKAAPNKEAGGSSKGRLELGAGYSISHREGSGYSIITKLLCEECHFVDVAETMSTRDKSRKTVLWMSVDRQTFEKTIRNSDEWADFAKRKYEALKKRADQGEEAAIKTLQNKSRVEGTTWIGNIPEMLSVMCGSGNADNRNVWKFQNAGITIAIIEVEKKQRITIYPAKFDAFFKQSLASCQ